MALPRLAKVASHPPCPRVRHFGKKRSLSLRDVNESEKGEESACSLLWVFGVGWFRVLSRVQVLLKLCLLQPPPSAVQLVNQIIPECPPVWLGVDKKDHHPNSTDQLPTLRSADATFMDHSSAIKGFAAS